MERSMQCAVPAVAILSLLLLPGLAVAREGATGIVAATQGEAWVVRGEAREAARVGLEVRVGDALETGRKGRVKVLLTDDSVLSLGGETRLVVERHLFEPGRARETHLRLLGGRARALVQQVVGGSRARFEISAGTAVAGVRGTEFVVEQGAEGARVVTLSGAVEWSAAGGGGERVLVSAGEGSAPAGGRPRALAAAELVRVKAETDSDAGPEALAWNLGPAEGLSGRTGPAAPAEEVQGRDGREPGGAEVPGQLFDGSVVFGEGEDTRQLGGSSQPPPFVGADTGQLPEQDLLPAWQDSYLLEPPGTGSGYRLDLTIRLGSGR